MEKYNELLEKAKEAYKKCATYEGRIILESLFHELAESEDEKIRKEIIAVFKGQITFTTEEQGKKYIAWLEKQACHIESSEKPTID